MKQFFLLLLLMGAFSARGQSPQAFNYQSVVRDAQGNPLSNQSLNFEVSIVQKDTVVYGETQSKTTNQFGLVDIKVGQGTAFKNTFSGINWGNGAAVIRVKVNGVPLPESPILSVPYALYALKSGGSAADSWIVSGTNNIYRANGNVGIGVNLPEESLHTVGNIQFTENKYIYFKGNYLNLKSKSDNINVLNMRGSQSYGSRMDFYRKGDATVGLSIDASSQENIIFYRGNYLNFSSFDDNISVLNIKSSQNWGSRLDIYKKGNAAVGISFDSDGNSFISGNLGIGTTNPQSKLHVNGTASVSVLEVRGADIVEKFKSKETIEAGTLVTIDATDIHNYKTSQKAYQKGIVGIVSGANGVNHGMLLEQDDALAGNTKVAIAGRVYVKATAQNGAIKAGDFLTSSTIAGYAMKSTNRRKAYGAVIGKALTNLESGEGFVLVLVGLQ